MKGKQKMTANNYVSASSDREADIAIAKVKRSLWADLSRKINPENPDRSMIERAVERGFQPEGKDLEKEPVKVREMIQSVVHEKNTERKRPIYICSHNGGKQGNEHEHIRGE